MSDIAGQIAQIQNLAREIRSTLTGIDEVLTGPKPSSDELAAVGSSGLSYELDDALEVLAEAKAIATSIRHSIHDERPQNENAYPSTISDAKRCEAIRVS